MQRIRAALVLLLAVAAACNTGESGADTTAAAAQTAEATSLLGKPLYRRTFSAEQRATLERNLAAARAAYERTPQDVDSIIWLGRRQAYLEQYQDAIKTFTSGIELWPDDPRLYRHRGHRYITVREFDKAEADLETAVGIVRGRPDEIEPDGAPNARNIPTSTTQGNIWYHLALVRYLKGDYRKSVFGWEQAMRLAKDDDTRVAVSDWLYMTLRRLGREDEAREVLRPITAGMDIIENTAYHRRLLMYKGEIPPDSLLNPNAEPLQFVTQGYGVANWYLANGDTARANAILDKVLESGYWAAFGYIAAEADVARRGAR
jgi:tetratricopeptide (TPR) repeat protein